MLSRREKFFKGTRAAHLVAGLQDDRDNPLATRLLDQARSQIEAQAAALHIPSIPSGVLDQMLAHAKQRLAQLLPSELARVGAGNALMTEIAQESFGAVVGTRDPASIKSLFAAFAAGEKNGGKIDEPLDKSAMLLQQRQLANYGVGRDGKAAADYRSELGDRTIMENRSLARSLGMGWAAETDLMRLPRYELMALAASKITETTYRGLHDLKFSDKGVVAMAEHAKKNGLDINKMYEKQKEYGEIVGGGDAKKVEEYHRAIQQFFLDKKDNKPDADQVLRDKLRAMPTTPEGRKAVEDTELLLKIQARKELDNEKKADVKDKKADDLLAELQAEPEKPKASETMKPAGDRAEAAKPEAVKSAEISKKEPDKSAAQKVATVPKPPTPAA